MLYCLRKWPSWPPTSPTSRGADGAFDTAIVSHVLEHVPDDLGAMRELRRVLANDGIVLSHHPSDPERERTFEDPSITSSAERARVFGQADHVRIYGRDLPERWTAAGFIVEDLGQGALAARPVPQVRPDVRRLQRHRVRSAGERLTTARSSV